MNKRMEIFNKFPFLTSFKTFSNISYVCLNSGIIDQKKSTKHRFFWSIILICTFTHLGVLAYWANSAPTVVLVYTECGAYTKNATELHKNEIIVLLYSRIRYF